MAALPSQTITGTTGADVRSSTPGSNALIETYQGADTITLSNGGDYALGGSEADSIVLGSTSVTTLANSVIGGDGADTIKVLTAGHAFGGAVGASLEANKGADSIYLGSAVGSISNLFIGGGADADTIVLTNTAAAINSTVRGGSTADSITVSSGLTLQASIVEGNKGADFLRVDTEATTNGSVGGGAGVDTIVIGSTAAGGAGLISWLNGGAGTDSIQINSGASVASLAGGGLADTIKLIGDFAGGAIYGDAVGVTTSGTGTGGTADGADLIGSTATNLTGATSVYGAGGSDSIIFNTANAGLVIDGGDNGDYINVVSLDAASTISGGKGADSITIATASSALKGYGGAGNDTIYVEAGSALTVDGGAGNDTIMFSNATATSIDGGDNNDLIVVGTATTSLESFLGSVTAIIGGGAGADSISIGNFQSAASIFGGAGADSITISNSTAVSGDTTSVIFAQKGTINGGEGADVIVIGGGTAIAAYTATTAGFSAGVASIVYGSGDSIRIALTAVSTGNIAGGVIDLVAATTVDIDNTNLAADGTITKGSLNVWTDGTDTYFAFANNATGVVAFRVSGKDLVTYTGAAGNVGATTANFGFTTTSDATGITLTLA